MGKTYRFIHCADIHLDSSMTTNFDAKKAQLRQIEIFESFLKMISYGVENNVDGILISGDLFDTYTVSSYVIRAFLETIRKHSNIHFYYLRGNHDLENRLLAEINLPENLHLFDREWKSFFLGNKICISGCEFIDYDSKNLYETANFDEDYINIVMLHGEISKTFAHNERDSVDLTCLVNKNIDYLALGHIHQHMVGQLDHRGVYVYPGCLEARGYDEVGEHGFVWLEINEDLNSISYEFVPFARRHAYVISVDISSCENEEMIISCIDNEIHKTKASSLDLLKVVLVGERNPELEFHEFFIEHRFESQFFHFLLEDHTNIYLDPLTYAKDPTLKGEFVRTVLAHETFTNEEKNKIIQCGLRALEGKEISK